MQKQFIDEPTANIQKQNHARYSYGEPHPSCFYYPIEEKRKVNKQKYLNTFMDSQPTLAKQKHGAKKQLTDVPKLHA